MKTVDLIYFWSRRSVDQLFEKIDRSINQKDRFIWGLIATILNIDQLIDQNIDWSIYWLIVRIDLFDLYDFDDKYWSTD